jgi:hypothetical protein
MANGIKYRIRIPLLTLVGASAIAIAGSGCAAGLAGSGAGYDYMSRDPTNHLNIKQRNAAGALSGLAYALASMKDNRALQDRQWAHEDARSNRPSFYDLSPEEQKAKLAEVKRVIERENAKYATANAKQSE